MLDELQKEIKNADQKAITDEAKSIEVSQRMLDLQVSNKNKNIFLYLNIL